MSEGRLEHDIEGRHKPGVSVVDQEMDGRLALLQLPNRLASLLRYSGCIGMVGAAREIDAACVQLDKEQHVHRMQEERVHGEEIAGQNLLPIVGHQMPPADRALALWRWKDAVPFQDIGNRLLTDGIAQF